VQSRQGFTVEGLEERCKALERILDETTKKNANLENKVMILQDENITMKADYEAKITEVKTFRMVVKEKFEKEKELNELKTEYEAFKTKQREAEQQYRQAEQNAKVIEQLESENERLANQTESLKQEVIDHNATVTKLRKEYEAQQADVNEKTKMFDELTHEVKTLRAREQSLNEDLASIKSQFDEFKVESGIFAKRTQNVLMGESIFILIFQ